jgi:hypothetical protein
MPFEVIETKEHTDDGHGGNYSAKHMSESTAIFSYRKKLKF